MGKPNSLVVDVASANKPGMVYVMLSRVQCLDQLIILDAMDPEKISVNDQVAAEAARMWKVSLNRNPCQWMNPATEGLKVCSLNTLSLRKHMEDVRSDPVLLKSQVLCLQETWLEEGEEEQDRYQLEGYEGHFTSVGRGRGVVTYVKEGLQVLSHHKFAEDNLQLIKTCLRQLDVISIYRSRDKPLPEAADILQNFIEPDKDTLIVGDFNISAIKTNALSTSLEMAGFHQHVNVPTHIKGGTFKKEYLKSCICHNHALSGILDHAHHRGSSTRVAVTTSSHYFSDHESVNCIVTNSR